MGASPRGLWYANIATSGVVKPVRAPTGTRLGRMRIKMAITEKKLIMTLIPHGFPREISIVKNPNSEPRIVPMIRKIAMRNESPVVASSDQVYAINSQGPLLWRHH